MKRLHRMESCPALFPDLLDRMWEGLLESHVCSIASDSRVIHGIYDDRTLAVIWNDQKWFVNKVKPWCVEIRHYLSRFVKHGRQSQMIRTERAISRKFDCRAEAVEFAERLLKRFEAVEISRLRRFERLAEAA